MNKNEIIYLAIPYTWNAERSFEIVNKVAADLITKGYIVISPISSSHPISKHMDKKYQFDQNTWQHQDLPILERCDVLLLIIIN